MSLIRKSRFGNESAVIKKARAKMGPAVRQAINEIYTNAEADARKTALKIARRLKQSQRQRDYVKASEPTRPRPDHCELCGEIALKPLYLDHCHVTGKFRGWLCPACNAGLGMLGDDMAGLMKAVEYLYRFNPETINVIVSKTSGS